MGGVGRNCFRLTRIIPLAVQTTAAVGLLQIGILIRAGPCTNLNCA